MYYVSDNVLWAVGLMVRNGVLGNGTEHAWKNRKNTFSQANVVVNILRLCVLLVMRDMYIIPVICEGKNERSCLSSVLNLTHRQLRVHRQ